jgi:hypothetical protein
MTAATGLHDELARLLWLHQHKVNRWSAGNGYFCTCGARIASAPEDALMCWNDHLAAVIVESDWLTGWVRQQQAEAWDDGWDECAIHKAACDHMGPGQCRDMPPNPFEVSGGEQA